MNKLWTLSRYHNCNPQNKFSTRSQTSSLPNTMLHVLPKYSDFRFSFNVLNQIRNIRAKLFPHLPIPATLLEFPCKGHRLSSDEMLSWTRLPRLKIETQKLAIPPLLPYSYSSTSAEPFRGNIKSQRRACSKKYETYNLIWPRPRWSSTATLSFTSTFARSNVEAWFARSDLNDVA